MSDQRIIFLDYDGVICHQMSRYTIPESEDIYSGEYLDITKLRALKRIQELTGALFVTCSAAHTRESKEEQERIIASYGVNLEFHEDWAVPRGQFPSQALHDQIVAGPRYALRFEQFPDMADAPWATVSIQRGMHILEWLHNHPEIRPENFLILDDSSDMYPIPQWNHVWVKYGEHKGGFDFDHCLEIFRKFGVDQWT